MTALLPAPSPLGMPANPMTAPQTTPSPLGKLLTHNQPSRPPTTTSPATPSQLGKPLTRSHLPAVLR